MQTRNHITLLQKSEVFFQAVEAALHEAVHEIYLESYIFENDHSGRRITEALRRAAVRGVKTHLLIDGFGSNRLPQTMIDYLENAGVMVRKFRPKISPWTFRRRRLRRLHRKIVVVDVKIAFIGGMNICDQEPTPEQMEPCFDFAVSVEGPTSESNLCVVLPGLVARNQDTFTFCLKPQQEQQPPSAAITWHYACSVSGTG